VSSWPLPRWLAYAAGAAVTAGALSAVYQAACEAGDRRRFPPPSRMTDIGGRRVHVLSLGSGSPPIVAIPALGGNSMEMLSFFRTLADENQVCLYDRPGLGWSDAPPRGRRSFGDMADELQRALAGAGVEPPYVIAGHSVGGIVAQHFAARYPEQTAGLLLIDSSHQQQGVRFQVNGRPSATLLRRRALRRRLRVLGAYRLYVMTGRGRLNAVIREDVLPEHAAASRAMDLTSRHRSTVVREMLLMARRNGPPPGLGSVPVTVLTAADHDETWMGLQEELARLSTRSVHVIADEGGHYLHRDNPKLVTAALRDLLARITAGTDAPEKSV
jgi:pimeloyl-ACP methyl ester carboxylesterase